MSNLGNKSTMAKNIQYYMSLHHKSRNDMCDALGVKYTTFTDWVKGNTYPRIDKIELMANYFGIEKSDLVEERSSRVSPAPSPVQDIQQLLFDEFGPAAEGMLLYSQLDIEDRAEIKGEMRQMLKAAKYTTKPFTREDLHKALDHEHTQERQREA